MFNIFNKFAKKFTRTSATDFEQRLTDYFDAETCAHVQAVLTSLGLPLPDKKGTFMLARKGALLFLEDYGVVIRIESKPAPHGHNERINNSDWVLQPLASLPAGKALIEICAGCAPATMMEQAEFVSTQLKKEGISYADIQLVNTGLLPFKTPSFPKGIPVVIDRLAVNRFKHSLSPLKTHFSRTSPQKALYVPLKNAFKAAWPEGQAQPDPEKMRDFWQLCAKNVTAGILVAGWKIPIGDIDDYNDHYEKKNRAITVGKAYAKKL
jgi:hypothetical protein